MPSRADRRRRRYGTTVTAALAVGMVLVLVVGVAAHWAIDSVLKEARDETRDHETFVLLERMVAKLEVADSWHSRYLLTGRKEDLANYQLARTHVSEALFRLRPALMVTRDVSRLRRLS